MSVHAMDRISELPPFIIHQIMSYLSTDAVAKTRVLSKRWNLLRSSFPILDFDQSYVVGPYVDHQNFLVRKKNKRFRKRLRKFMKVVDVSLLRFCQLDLCIQKFRLFVGLLDVNKSASLVDKWISLVVEKEVKELDLEVITDYHDVDEVYNLPQTIFSAKLVKILRFSGCRLEQPSVTMRLNSLKKLTLDRVFLTEEIVQKLASECPLLEDLLLSCCQGLKYLRVFEASKLKSMTIYADPDEVESIQIAVPSLQNFCLEWQRTLRPKLFDLTGCLGLKKLNLVHVSFTDQEFDFIPHCPLLEDLCLIHCNLLERITISSTQLTSLKFIGCVELETITISSNQLKKLEISCLRNLKALKVDTPNLTSFIYNNNPIPNSSINAPCPWRVSYVPLVEFDNGWCHKLRKFLAESDKIEKLAIDVTEDMSSFNLEEFRESCRSPSCHVEKLDVHIGVPPPYYKILLNGFLGVFYPKTLSVGTMNHAKHELFKWVYNDLKNTDVNCCNYQHIKCWRHYLKDVEIEGFFRRHKNYKLFDRNNLMKLLNTDVENLMEENVWCNLPEGELRFHLHWCF